jgi:peptidoglycan hydrolase-like protein with peptidoglycan-binding domain
LRYGRAFQEKVQLTADGIVGPRTWRELIGRNPD